MSDGWPPRGGHDPYVPDPDEPGERLESAIWFALSKYATAPASVKTALVDAIKAEAKAYGAATFAQQQRRESQMAVGDVIRPRPRRVVRG